MTRLAALEKKLAILQGNLDKLDVQIIKPSQDSGMKDSQPTMVAALLRRQDITTQIAAVSRQIENLQSVENAA